MLVNARKLKLLHICSYTWEIGGPPSVIFNLSSHYKKFVDTDIVSTTDSDHSLYLISPGQKLFVFKKSLLSKFISDCSFSLFFWFKKNVIHYDYIVVHGLWNFGSILVFFLNKHSRLILTIHGFLDPYVLKKSNLFKSLYWKLFQKHCFEKAYIIHAISSDEEILLKELFPRFIDKIKFIPNGIKDPMSVNTNNSADENFKCLVNHFLSDSDYTFLYIGRINQKKGIDLIFESFYSLVDSCSKNIKLIIAGPIDNYSFEFEGLKRRFSHSNILILRSTISNEKEFLFNHINAFLLPSYSEGFSMAALEAISYGKACIFSNKIGFSSEALNSNAALICDLNVRSLKDKMSLLINDLPLNLLLIKNSRCLFLNNYQIEDIARRYFQEIILIDE